MHPSSPSATRAYSRSSVTFASPFVSFNKVDQSLLHLSSIVILLDSLLIKSSVSLSTLSNSSLLSFFSKGSFAASVYHCRHDFASPTSFLSGSDIVTHERARLETLLAAPFCHRGQGNFLLQSVFLILSGLKIMHAHIMCILFYLMHIQLCNYINNSSSPA